MFRALYERDLYVINVKKKLRFTHELTASDTYKTAKITKKDYPPAHRVNVNVLLNTITFL